MKCPRCESEQVRKNGRPRGVQRYLCKACGKQFMELLDGDGLRRQWPESALAKPAPTGGSSTKRIAPATVVKCDRGIAILLLDAENLKLDINTEKFLASLCSYPLEVKIAFANWKNPSTGKLDTELYDRGYELIHVPGGSNSADGKMIAFGAAILYRYPAVREVFVCSSDGLLNHLCNQLQNQGLTVFRVRRQNAILSVENHLTGESKHYSCGREMEIPSLEDLANQISELLKAEHKSIEERIAQFSSVAELFQERRTLAFNSTSSNNAAAMLQSAEKEITQAAKEPLPPVAVNQNIATPQTIAALNSTAIDSLDALEKILLEMIEAAIVESKEDAISVVKIKKNFFNTYECHADLIVKHFLANSSLIKFLQSRASVFQLTLNGSEHQVAIAQKDGPSKTDSPAALESSLAKIVRALTAQSPGSFIPIPHVASEFKKQYGQPITKKLKALKLDSPFPDFLQSCPTFKVQKKGKGYQVAIALSQFF